MKQLLLTFIALTLAAAVMAQVPGGGRPGGGQMPTGSFYGKIVDSITGKPIDAASVQLLQQKFDSVTKTRGEVIVGGMLTQSNGDFRIEGIPAMGRYKLTISAIGFKTSEQTVGLVDMAAMQRMRANNQDVSSLFSQLDKDLGNIKLKIDEQLLNNVTVTGSKPLVQLGIDRKIYNVEKDLSAAGGTATDILKNVPSLNVDIDGNVLLRNASPQIFVDGRPTTLTLEQIPADQIQSVEVITNPSAKFDASGGTAGILNIVLKKARRVGYNGNVRAGIDMRGRVNAGGDINVRQGKVNVFANANFGQRKSISDGTTDRSTYLSSDTTLILRQHDRNINRGFFAFGRVGMDYFLDNRNTFTISGTAVRGQFKTNVNSDIFVDSSFPSGISSAYTKRLSNSEGNFRNLGGALSYLHNFPKSGHQLTADVNVNKSRNNNENILNNDIYAVAGGPKTGLYRQLQTGKGTNGQFTIQTDYTNPLTANSKMELGARMSQRDVNSRNDIGVINPDGSVTVLPPLSSNYSYTDRVFAGYGTYSGKMGERFGYQLGLRLESSDYSGTVYTSVRDGSAFKDTSSTYSISYPVSLFPSVFLSQKVNSTTDLQLNYSRRINRPNFFQLFPFTDYSDSLNLNRGNPNLRPEFTNSFELSYSKTLPKNNSLLISAYYKRTTDLITRYQSREKNPITDSLVFVNTYINANSSFVGGLEFIVKNKITKWWDLTTNLNVYTSKINIDDETIATAGQIYSWFAKINNSFKLPYNFSMQLTGDYTSRTVLAPGGSSSSGGGGRMGGFGQVSSGNAQGYSKPTYGVDAALKYEFMKNKVASLTLSASDIFRTRVSDIYTMSESFDQHVVRVRDQQFFRLNFSYRFGKFDMSLFKRKNTRGDQENMQNSMQGAQ